MTAALILGAIAIAALSFAAGWSAAEQRLMKRQADHAFEKSLVRIAILGHVGGSE